MNPEQEPRATGVGSSRRDRWRRALGWGGSILVATLLMSRAFEHRTALLVLALVLSAVIFVVILRERPAIVTDDEIRLPRRTIRREGVVRVSRSLETTALIFHGEGGVVGVADLHGRSGEFRDALRAHGWPEVGPPA